MMIWAQSIYCMKFIETSWHTNMMNTKLIDVKSKNMHSSIEAKEFKNYEVKEYSE